jgi:hypothetical protein
MMMMMTMTMTVTITKTTLLRKVVITVVAAAIYYIQIEGLFRSGGTRTSRSRVPVLLAVC